MGSGEIFCHGTTKLAQRQSFPVLRYYPQRQKEQRGYSGSSPVARGRPEGKMKGYEGEGRAGGRRGI